MSDVITLGADAELDGQFEDVDGQAVDPSNLALTVVNPDASVSTVNPLTFTHVATGHWRAAFHPTMAGVHKFLWSGTGSTPAALDGEFYVRQPLTAPYEGWQPPAAATIDEQSNVDFESLGITPVQLERMVAAAVAWTQWVTGRTLDPTLPAGLVPLAEEALRLRVELIAFKSTADSVQNIAAEGISSMSVGGVSLTYRDPNSSTRSGGVAGVPALTPSQVLNDDLWALMTDEMRDYWLARFAGGAVPSFAVTEPDFSWPSEASHGVRTSDFPWEPFYNEPSGWPGWGWD